VFEVDQLDERTRSGWSVIARGFAHDVDAGDIDRVRDHVTTWSPGPKDRWISIAVGEVTGRLLRGRLAPTNDDHGYL
jgi:hypothetical protein